ncbi:MAG: HNH endonuclease [Prevotella sp.]|nr:HNH endonuclease [Prevotella sp.]
MKQILLVWCNVRTTDIENCQMLCKECNRRKGAK